MYLSLFKRERKNAVSSLCFAFALEGCSERRVSKRASSRSRSTETRPCPRASESETIRPAPCSKRSKGPFLKRRHSKARPLEPPPLSVGVCLLGECSVSHSLFFLSSKKGSKETKETEQARPLLVRGAAALVDATLCRRLLERREEGGCEKLRSKETPGAARSFWWKKGQGRPPLRSTRVSTEVKEEGVFRLVMEQTQTRVLNSFESSSFIEQQAAPERRHATARPSNRAQLLFAVSDECSKRAQTRERENRQLSSAKGETLFETFKAQTFRRESSKFAAVLRTLSIVLSPLSEILWEKESLTGLPCSKFIQGETLRGYTLVGKEQLLPKKARDERHTPKSKACGGTLLQKEGSRKRALGFSCLEDARRGRAFTERSEQVLSFSLSRKASSRFSSLETPSGDS